jgi:hypothetical protein
MMTDTFTLRIEDIQPSQLYINKEKLKAVMNTLDDNPQQLEPIPIKELDGELVSIDGHTRLLAWLMKGHEEVECEWEDLEMSWEAYRICVNWCKDEGILNAYSLKNRIVGNEEYQKLWLDRCHEMQKSLGLVE